MKVAILGFIILLTMNCGKLNAQMNVDLISGKWRPDKSLYVLKQPDTLSLKVETSEKEFDLIFSSDRKLEELRNFHECISTPPTKGEKRVHALHDNYKWTTKGSWDLKNDILTLSLPTRVIVLKIIESKKTIESENSKTSSPINEILLTVMSVQEKQ